MEVATFQQVSGHDAAGASTMMADQFWSHQRRMMSRVRADLPVGEFSMLDVDYFNSAWFELGDFCKKSLIANSSMDMYLMTIRAEARRLDLDIEVVIPAILSWHRRMYIGA